MPTQTQVDNVYIAPATIYVGCTVPAANSDPTLTSGVPAGGTDIGFTSGPSKFSVKRTFKEIEVEQALGPIKAVASNEEVTVETELAEVDYSKLQKFISGSAITVDTASTPKKRRVNGGGDSTAATSCYALVVKNPASGLYTAYYVYKAYVAEAFEISFGKADNPKMKVVLKGLADPTRAAGDQTYQIYEQYA